MTNTKIEINLPVITFTQTHHHGYLIRRIQLRDLGQPSARDRARGRPPLPASDAHQGDHKPAQGHLDLRIQGQDGQAPHRARGSGRQQRRGRHEDDRPRQHQRADRRGQAEDGRHPARPCAAPDRRQPRSQEVPLQARMREGHRRRPRVQPPHRELDRVGAVPSRVLQHQAQPVAAHRVRGQRGRRQPVRRVRRHAEREGVLPPPTSRVTTVHGRCRSAHEHRGRQAREDVHQHAHRLLRRSTQPPAHRQHHREQGASRTLVQGSVLLPHAHGKQQQGRQHELQELPQRRGLVSHESRTRAGRGAQDRARRGARGRLILIRTCTTPRIRTSRSGVRTGGEEGKQHGQQHVRRTARG